MSEVADGNFMLLLDGGEERPLIVYAEGEDAVLIRSHKLSAEHGASICASDGLEGQAMEGGKHGELELELVSDGNFKWNPLVVNVLGNLNLVDLETLLMVALEI
jgi:hypothetical protein